MKKRYLLLFLTLPAVLMSCQTTGPTGPKGDKGETGQRGSDGKGIVSVVLTSSTGNRDTYTIIYTDGSTSVFYVTNGEDGIQGEPGKDGHTPVVTIGDNGNWFIDGVDSGFRAQGPKGDKGDKGESGKGIESIVLSDHSNGVSTYTVLYTDGTTSTFKVRDGQTGEIGPQGIQGVPGEDGHTPVITIGDNGNWFVDGVDSGVKAQGDKGDKGDAGEQGPQGEKGDKGDKGDSGKDGISVVSIVKTSSDGNKDTYTITYTDGSTSTFVVTNGADGPQGIQGVPGENGHSPVISIGTNGDWYVDGTDTGVKAQGPKGDKGDKGDKGEDAITYIPCIFNNYDGTKLYEFYYEKGSDIVYDGPTPTKTTTDEDGNTLDWTFVGWDKSLECIQKPTIFTAQFEYLYTCTFVNWDGSVLQTGKVSRGESAVYDGPTPAKPSEKSGDQTIEWSFSGWDKSLDNIKCDTVFTAKFDAPNAIKLTFKNDDGSVLFTQYCGVNATAKYAGPTPIKEDVDDGDGNITKYEFSGWDKPLKGIKCDTTFTAVYTETPYYRCRFYDSDGTLLYTTSTFGGGYIQYQGITPTKPQEANGTTVTEYAFSDWDASLSDISSPTDFHPVFTSTTFTGYKVTFMDDEGKNELYSHYFKEGTAATYPYETPWSYDDEGVTMFFGWSEPISSITEATTVTMRVKTIDRAQNGEYPQTKVTDQNTISALEKLSQPSDGSYLQYDGEKYELVKSDYYKVEPIRWRYLSQDDGSALLLSESILDAKRYNAFWSGMNNDGYYANNYKQSEIRKWLNDEFFDKAFGDPSLIATTAVDNSVSSTGDSSNPYVCETTNDNVFLLSYKEAMSPEFGFSSNQTRIAYGTDYAKANGLSSSSNNASNWWIRSPDGDNSYGARFVCGIGGVSSDYVDYSDSGVRPAIRMNLD